MTVAHICGLNYEIVERNEKLEMDGNMGESSVKLGKIMLSSSMPKETQEATLVHEWVHMVLSNYGIDHLEQVASVLGIELFREYSA